MTLLSQAAAATDTDFIARVTQAAIKAANDVNAEAANTTGHALRTQFALQVLRASQVFGPLIAQGVVAGGLVTGASTDNDILFTVNSLWNSYAGVVL